MRDPTRIDRVLGLLRTIWVNYPDFRLGQIIVNCMPTAEPVPPVFFVEDAIIESGMHQFFNRHSLSNRADVSISLTKNEAVVLMHMFAAFSGASHLPVADSAEAKVLHNLCCILEKQLIEPFRTDWTQIVADAKQELSPES